MQILIKRGLSADIASAGVVDGELKYAKDTKKLYIGTGTENVMLNPAGTVPTWGSITGDLDDQTDLKNALALKADSATTLGGYGITDAKIVNSTITLGSNALEVYSKADADLTFATKATTLAGYGITDAYTKTEVDEKMAGAFHYMGSCTYAELIAKTGMKKGDTWNVTDAHEEYPAGTNYAWSGTAWDPLGGIVDLSNYYKKTEVDTLLSAKADSATTLAGYGITDAKIDSGVITLGGNTITPVTDVSGKVDKTQTIAGLALSGDITALQMETALSEVVATYKNKTIDADNNTISNLTTANLKSGVLVTTIRATASASDASVASEKAIATEIESINTALASKVNINQGVVAAGKYLKVGTDGNLELTDTIDGGSF